MSFVKLGHYRANLKNICYYPGSDYVNMVGFGNRLNVPDQDELKQILTNHSKSPKSPIFKIQDGERTIFINVDNLQYFRYARKGMTLSFYGHTLQLNDLEAIAKVLKKLGEEATDVGRSGNRDSLS